MADDFNRENGVGIPAFSKLFGGLVNFIETIGEMVEDDSKEKLFTGEITPGKKIRGSYGINVILDPVNSPATKSLGGSPFSTAEESKESSRFEIHTLAEELLVVGEWGEYTLEDTTINVIGKTLYIKGKKKGSTVTERLILSRAGYTVNQAIYNNGILQITLT